MTPTGFLLEFLLFPEAGGHVFFRNVGISSNYEALQPTMPYSSFGYCFPSERSQRLDYVAANIKLTGE
jgi:hypothetical protein